MPLLHAISDLSILRGNLALLPVYASVFCLPTQLHMPHVPSCYVHDTTISASLPVIHCLVQHLQHTATSACTTTSHTLITHALKSFI